MKSSNPLPCFRWANLWMVLPILLLIFNIRTNPLKRDLLSTGIWRSYIMLENLNIFHNLLTNYSQNACSLNPNNLSNKYAKILILTKREVTHYKVAPNVLVDPKLVKLKYVRPYFIRINIHLFYQNPNSLDLCLTRPPELTGLHIALLICY